MEKVLKAEEADEYGGGHSATDKEWITQRIYPCGMWKLCGAAA
jgi:hypothetical protein